MHGCSGSYIERAKRDGICQRVQGPNKQSRGKENRTQKERTEYVASITRG